MRKLFSMIALAIAFALSLPSQAQSVIMVGDSATTERNSMYGPVHFNWKYSYFQTIYMSEELIPGTITSISYQYDDAISETAPVTIYLAEVDRSSFETVADWIPFSELTEVYSSTMTFSEGWATFELETPFDYSGAGNLVVAVLSNRGSCPGPRCFKITTGSYPKRFLSKLSDNVPIDPATVADGDLFQVSTFPNTKFEVTVSDDYCWPVEQLTVTNITQTSASVNWTAHESSTTFKLEYKLASEENWTLASDNITDNNYDLNGLNSYANYQVRVSSVCASSFSDPKQANFVTLPSADFFVPADYSENFDNVASITDWTITNAADNGWYLGTAENCPTSTSAATSGALYISNDGGLTSGYNSTQSAISYASVFVSFPEAVQNSIEFDWKAYGEGADSYPSDYLQLFLLPVSYEANTTEVPSYGDITDKLRGVNSWQREVVVLPDTCAGQSYKLVFVWKNDSYGGLNPAAAVDNIKITSSECYRVQGISFITTGNGSSVSASLTMEDNNTGGSYFIEYRIEGSDTWLSSTQGSPATLSDLLYGTRYEVRVRAICSTEESVVSESFYFNTPCSAILEFPWQEGFEASAVPADNVIGNKSATLCWYNINGGALGASFGVNAEQYYSRNGNGSLKYQGEMWGATDAVHSDWYITPVLSLQGNERLTFHMRYDSYASYNSSNPVVEIYVLDLTNGDMVSTADTSRFEHVGTVSHSVENNNYAFYEVYLNEYSADTRLAFAVRQKIGTIYIDDVEVSEIPACPDVYGLAVELATANSVNVSFNTSNGNGSGWVIAYGTAESAEGFDPANAEMNYVMGADEEMPEIEELETGVTYYFAVRQNCEGGAFSEVCSITMPIVTDLPYYQDFSDVEGVDEWIFVTDGYAAQSWVVGAAVNADSEGEGGALYVSNDGGESNEYDIFTYSDLKAYTIINLSEAETYNISFDWRAGGSGYEGYYYEDFMQAFLVPLSEDNLTSSAYSISPELALQSSQWQHFSTELTSADYAPGLYKLVFYWVNFDYGDGIQPAGAVDNIWVKQGGCSPITSVTATLVESDSPNTASISVDVTDANEGATYTLRYGIAGNEAWTELHDITEFPYIINGLFTSTTYNIEVAAVCGEEDITSFVAASPVTTNCPILSAPWNENFETTPFAGDCWLLKEGLLSESNYVIGSELTDGLYPGWEYNTTAALNGVVSGRIVTNIYATHKHWAITPTINLQSGSAYQLGFDVALAGNIAGTAAPAPALDDKFAVVVSTDNGDSWHYSNATVFADGDADTEHNISDLTTTPTRCIVDLTDVNNNPAYGYIKIAFYVESTAYAGDTYLFIDNITVEEQNNCPSPFGLTVIAESLTSNSATVSFTEMGSATQWQYVLAEGETLNTETAIPQTVSSSDMTVSLTQLGVSTTYTIAMRSVCGQGQYSAWSTPLTFTTLSEASPVPYSCDFEQEGDNGWLIDNGTETNKWFVGVVSAENSNRALFVSNDNAATATYSTDAASVVVAEKIFQTGNSEYLTISFDLTVGGDTDKDFLKVFWAPATESYTSGNAFAPFVFSDYSENVIMSNAAISSNHYLNLISGTQTMTATVPNAGNSLRKLVFVWKNDIIGGDGQAPVIDNITIEPATGGTTPDIEPCEAPTNITTVNLTQNYATISWSGTTSRYEVRLNGANNEIIEGTAKTYSDLFPSSDYIFEVRAVCEDEPETEWVYFSFRTLDEPVVEGDAPRVETLEAVNVTANSATLQGIAVAGEEQITSQGFAVWIDGSDEPDYWFEVGEGENMSYEMTNLQEATTYYFAAFAVTGELGGEDEQTYRGETLSFTTLSGLSDVANGAMSAMIYPNPASDKAILSVEGLISEAQVVVSDAQGRIMFNDTMSAGAETYELNTESYAAGVYYVRIISGNTVSTQKLIVR